MTQELTIYDTYPAWNRNVINKTAHAAWNYQQKKLELVFRSFNKEVASQVLNSRDGLKQSIIELKAMAKENILAIEKLEQEKLDLQIELKEAKDGESN